MSSRRASVNYLSPLLVPGVEWRVLLRAVVSRNGSLYDFRSDYNASDFANRREEIEREFKVHATAAFRNLDREMPVSSANTLDAKS